MSILKNMRVIRIPPFRAVTSGTKTFDELFAPDGFAQWCESHMELIRDLIYEPSDFLWHEGARETYGHGQNVWIWALNDGVTAADTAPYEITEFPGGIFLAATCNENDPADLEETVSCMLEWISESPVFEYGDFPRSGMCNMPAGDEAIDQALGVSQQQIFLPLKYRLPKS
jgi:hypothetical protein